MWRAVRYVLGAALAGLVIALVVFFVGMRTKYRPVMDAVRMMNKATWNPRAMRTAGQPGSDVSIIRHVGRTTGTPYETPVGAVETEEGFVISLPYSTTPDWYKNVVAAGSATLVHDGATHRVVNPQVVAASVVSPHFDDSDQRAFRAFGIDEFLVLSKSGTIERP